MYIYLFFQENDRICFSFCSGALDSSFILLTIYKYIYTIYYIIIFIYTFKYNIYLYIVNKMYINVCII